MLNKITEYFKGVWRELTKVTWPDKKDVANHTLIVIVVCAVAIGIVSAMDFGLSKAVEYLLSIR